jgi:hypothetical protein
MKNAAITLVSVLLLGLSACQKTKDDINEATEFDMTYSTQVAIPSTSLNITAPADFTSPEIPTESSAKFAANSTTKDLIEEIKMSKLEISNPSGNLDFLNSMTIYLKTTDLGDVKVASKSNIPKGSTSVLADLENVNIKEYIFRDKIQFRVTVNITTGNGLNTEQKLKVDQTLHVKGKKL